MLIKVDEAYDKVSFQYYQDTHGGWQRWLESLYPTWKSRDIVSEWFEASKIPNLIQRAQELDVMTPQSKRVALRDHLKIALDPERTQPTTPESDSPGIDEQVEVRRSKRNRLAYDEVELTDSEGGTPQKVLIEVPTPEFKARLQEMEALELCSSLEAALAQYDRFVGNIDEHGYIKVPRVPKTKAKAKTSRPSKDQVIAKLGQVNASLHARLVLAKKTAAAGGSVEDFKTKLKDLQAELDALKTEHFTLREKMLDLKAETAEAKAELAMEKIRTDGKIHKARAEIYADYVNKQYATPGSRLSPQ